MPAKCRLNLHTSFQSGFTDEERSEAKRAIYANIFDSIEALVDAQEMFGLALGSNKLDEEKSELRQFIHQFRQSEQQERIEKAAVEVITNLWNSETIKGRDIKYTCIRLM